MSLTNRLTSFSWVFLISEASFTLASSRQQLNFSVKITRNCAGFLNYSFWLIEITCTTLSVTNQILNWNQSRTGHSHWQELWTVCWLLLRVLIGPLWYFFVLIGRWDHLAFDFTTLSKKNAVQQTSDGCAITYRFSLLFYLFSLHLGSGLFQSSQCFLLFFFIFLQSLYLFSQLDIMGLTTNKFRKILKKSMAFVQHRRLEWLWSGSMGRAIKKKNLNFTLLFFIFFFFTGCKWAKGRQSF